MTEKALAIYEQPVEAMRRATDAAGATREIVMRTAVSIQGKKYVKVEGWQAIAIAHGCMASSGEVARVYAPDGALLGWQAVGEVRRAADGAMLAKAEGFVGLDEQKWGGGGPKNLPPSAEYACRAMAQTRAISRACRSAFAHVVVMIDAGLSTTPAEEVPDGGLEHEPQKPAPTNGEVARCTPSQLKALHTALTELGILQADRKVWVSTRLHKDIASSADLTQGQCSTLIRAANDEINAKIAENAAAADGPDMIEERAK